MTSTFANRKLVQFATSVLITTFLMPSGAAFAQLENDQPLSATVNYQENRYLLGSGDVVSFQVDQEPDYSQERVLVGPDGHAHFNGVGDIDVKNRTITEVTEEVTTRLKKIILNPKVNVALVRTKPCIVYLSGAVMHSGMFEIATSSEDVSVQSNSNSAPVIRTEMRLSNVLANAGGVTMEADLSNVQVKRALSGQVRNVDLWKTLKEGDQSQDVNINTGDSITVPTAGKLAFDDESFKLLLGSSIGPKVFPIRIIGEVMKPGVYNLDPTSPMLNSAIANAGGFSEQARRGVAAVRRFTENGKFTTLFVDGNKMDLMLRPNDVVFIPENRVYTAGRFGNQVARAFSPFQTITQAGANVTQIFGLGGWNRAIAPKVNANRFTN